MITAKCFAKGSAAPGPVPKGHIRLYSMRFCPFAQRARLVLNAKGIKKTRLVSEKNHLGLVPTLETEAGEVVYESPSPVTTWMKCIPKTSCFPKVIPYFYKIILAKKNKEEISGLVSELHEKFGEMDEALVKKKTKFFGADSITMIDYMIWPWFERLEAFDLKDLMGSTSELKKWYGRMQEDPVVRACSHNTESYKAFFKSALIDDKPDYDYGL
ncbi:hypothetical protein WMY93_017397 [Mugilogobius chulae]|uniref:Glutathione S-transferase omega n=1 Tax=Mugilogobius chulae TaxID=88201 RepID=A0AAW0NSW4_9GOBI